MNKAVSLRVEDGLTWGWVAGSWVSKPGPIQAPPIWRKGWRLRSVVRTALPPGKIKEKELRVCLLRPSSPPGLRTPALPPTSRLSFVKPSFKDRLL